MMSTFRKTFDTSSHEFNDDDDDETSSSTSIFSSLFADSFSTSIRAFHGSPSWKVLEKGGFQQEYYYYKSTVSDIVDISQDPSMLIDIGESMKIEDLLKGTKTNRDEFWLSIESSVVPESETWYQFYLELDSHADVIVFIDDTVLFSTTRIATRNVQNVVTGPVVSSKFSTLSTFRRNAYLHTYQTYRVRVVYMKRSTLRKHHLRDENIKVARNILKSFSETRLKLQYESNPQQVKIYVYDLPRKYNEDIVRLNEKCEKHMFAAEVHIHRQLLESKSRTKNPYGADLYYIPAYSSCKFLKRAFGVNPWFGRKNIENGVSYVQRNFPELWNRFMGRDHVTAVTYDFGACFEYKRDKAAKKGVIPVLSRMHILSSVADVSHPCFRPEIDVAIPVHVNPDTTRLLSYHVNDDSDDRKWLAHFQGSIEWFDHDPDYSNGIRQRLETLYGNDPEFHIGRGKVPTYASDMRNSTFCLCPPGFAPWSPRMYEAAAAGCIPVILTDHVKLPYDGTSLNWKEFSVKIREDDVTRLGEILRSIPMSRIRSKRRALRRVWTALSYNKIHGKENAIDHLLIEFRTRFSQTSINLNAKSIASVLTDEEWT